MADIQQKIQVAAVAYYQGDGKYKEKSMEELGRLSVKYLENGGTVSGLYRLLHSQEDEYHDSHS